MDSNSKYESSSSDEDSFTITELFAESTEQSHDSGLGSPSIWRSCTGSDVSAEESELRLENAILWSELNILPRFTTRLHSFRSQFPVDAAYAISWRYAVAVMTSLSVRKFVFLAEGSLCFFSSAEKFEFFFYNSV